MLMDIKNFNTSQMEIQIEITKQNFAKSGISKLQNNVHTVISASLSMMNKSI
jgi:hypothetical protein